MRALITKYGDDPVIGAYMKKLERALPNTFWFVLDPDIPLTNNPTERLTGDHRTQKDEGKYKVHGHDAMDELSVYLCYNMEEPQIGLPAAAIEVHLVYTH